MKRQALIIIIIGMISATTFGCISNSGTRNMSYSKGVETDIIVISIVESLKDNAKKNSTVTNLSTTYEGNKTATINYTFSNAVTNESGTVSYKIQRFSSITEAKEFTNISSIGYTKMSITSNDSVKRNYVKAAKHEPKVLVLLTTLQYSPPEEDLIVQLDDVVITGAIKISNFDFGT
jgi:hypothetical protein